MTKRVIYKILDVEKTINVRSTNLMFDLYVSYVLVINGCCFELVPFKALIFL